MEALGLALPYILIPERLLANAQCCNTCIISVFVSPTDIRLIYPHHNIVVHMLQSVRLCPTARSLTTLPRDLPPRLITTYSIQHNRTPNTTKAAYRPHKVYCLLLTPKRMLMLKTGDGTPYPALVPLFASIARNNAPTPIGPKCPQKSASR